MNILIYIIGIGGGDKGRRSNKDYSVIETFENYQSALRYVNNKKDDKVFCNAFDYDDNKMMIKMIR